MTKQELEQLELTHLSVLCGKVADDPSMEDVAEKALKLKQEWVLLIARDTPPPSDLQTHKEIEAKKQDLRSRMIDFLVLI